MRGDCGGDIRQEGGDLTSLESAPRGASRRVWRLAYFDIFRAIGTWRWLVVPPVFVLGGWSGADHAQFVTRVLNHSPGTSNFWDGALILPTSKYALVLGFVLGFVLVTGDLYVRDRQEGTASLTLLRSRSRTGWWGSKVLSLAPLALIYSTLAYLSALAGSALLLPVALGTSRAAEIPWSGGSGLYPRFEWMPISLFFLFVVLYTALALWALGSVVLAVSALYPRLIVPLVAGLAWVYVGVQLREPLSYGQGLSLNPVYHAAYVVNFSGSGRPVFIPWLYSVSVLGGTLFLAFVVGALWIRRIDV